MPEPSALVRTCAACTAPLRREQRRFCSNRCSGAARRTAVERSCAQCGATFPVQPYLLAQGFGRYCSKTCYGAAQRVPGRPAQQRCEQCGDLYLTLRRPAAQTSRFCSRRCMGLAKRKPPQRFACAHCGLACEVRAQGQESRRFCSRECWAASRRRSAPRSCATCGAPFEVGRSRIAQGLGRYCSRSCSQRGHRRRVELACAHCQGAFQVWAYLARTQRYCSQRCYHAARPAGRDLVCATCQQVRRVTAAAAARGARFCSHACYAQSRRRRVEATCPQCGEVFTAKPAQLAQGRRYCTLACARAVNARRTLACKVCGEAFVARRWQRGARYCSISCADRGRERYPSYRQVMRDSRVRRWSAEGRTAAEIARQLGQEQPAWKEWQVSPAAVRQVLSRARRSQKRTVTPPRRELAASV
jgi:hypothetical protein